MARSTAPPASRATGGKRLLSLLVLCASLGSLTCSDAPAGKAPSDLPPPAPVYGYTVVRAYPHDREAFTQGLAFDDQGALYEGTGQRGASSLRRVELSSGAVLQRHGLPASLFGEGITVFGDRIIQLTWQAGPRFRLRQSQSRPSAGVHLPHRRLGPDA